LKLKFSILKEPAFNLLFISGQNTQNGETSGLKGTNLGFMETTLKLTAKTQTNSHILHNAFKDDGFNQGSFTAHLFVLDCK